MKNSVPKVGVVTLYGNVNYGNRLQNYAVQQIIERRGFQAETLVAQKTTPKEIAKILREKYRLLKGGALSRRKKAFNAFNKKYIRRRTIWTRNGLLPSSLNRAYRYFVVGSDQVWNPEIRKRERTNFFLRFADEKRRACIAPSVGVSRIPDEYRKEFADYFRGFERLSCREAAGAADVAALSGKECEHILDPTLALSADEWRAFAKPIVGLDEPYWAVFYLGEMNPKIRTTIETTAKARGRKIVDLGDPKSPYFALSPNQFVALIDGAKLVFTDSFHAMAFSINLNVPFYAFDRRQKDAVGNHMASRIESLTTLLALQTRYIRGDELREPSEDCDFAAANRVLAEEREKFERYVDACLR